MAVLQSSYRRDATALVAGQIIDQQLSDAVTRILEDEANASFGQAMFTGLDGNSVTATPSTAFAGVTYHDQFNPPASAETFREGDSLPIAREGVVAVAVASPVTKGLQAYITPAGEITSDPTDNIILAGAKFARSGENIAPLRLSRIQG